MRLLVPALLAVMMLGSVLRAAGPFEDVPIGALPADSVKAALLKILSPPPQGRFVILAANGTVRIFDTPEKIAAARAALDALQNAPALVSFAVIFKTGMQKITKSASTGDETGGYPYPVPGNYNPPSRGGVIVRPGGGGAGPGKGGKGGAVVAYGGGYVPYQGGYVTGTVVNTEETSVEGGVQRTFAGSTVFPKPAAVTICARAPDAAALRDWAVRNGAVAQNEPPWTAARTEILVTPERTGDGMVLNLMPQIVVAAADGSPRVIPLRVCATSVTVKQGVPATFDGFPGADADFYRVFLGAQESAEGTLSSVTVGATVDYMAQQGGGK